MQHLIKRKPERFDRHRNRHGMDGWFCETRIGKQKPVGSRAKRGETIYIAESGYAIHAVGKLGEILPVRTITSADEYLRFAFQEAQWRDESYWLEVIGKVYGKANGGEPFQLNVLEYQIVDTNRLPNPHILTPQFLGQNAWYYIEGDDFQIDTIPPLTKLCEKIPSAIRMEMYDKFNLKSKSHLIDIDHHVPRSIGGPGNIIENLVPIGLSLNRYKSDNIPSKLFDYASRFGIRLHKKIDPQKVPYIKRHQHRRSFEEARQIVTAINGLAEEGDLQGFNEARHIYDCIRRFYYKNLPC